MERVLFIGGDKRMIYAAERLSQVTGVDTLGLGEKNLPTGRYDIIILPLPFSRNTGEINAPLCSEKLPLSLVSEYSVSGGIVFSGQSSPELETLCHEHELKLTDYFADESLTLKNAALTAEAAVSLLIQNTDSSLQGAEVLITGGGRIALLLVPLLRAFGAEVTLCARNPVQRTRAMLSFSRAEPTDRLSELCGTADIIINTAPAQLFGEHEFSRMKRTELFMELASLPAEPSKQFAEEQGIRYLHAAGLPGKISPKAAGYAIADTILSLIQPDDIRENIPPNNTSPV